MPQQLQHLRHVQEQDVIQQQRARLYQQMMMYQQQSTNLNNDSVDYIQSYQNEEKPISKAQKRAEHNAIERARRESLNTKFQQLAHSLPNLQNDRRPSKGTIIERTLEYVRQTVQKEENLKNEIDRLRQANEELISKMTSQHFNHYEEDNDDKISTTPECDDNFKPSPFLMNKGMIYHT
ncbi:uncharacterized protein BX663DRAFT_532329 [Cokeromyces recurvatus]|uniref:uncharacterized protein n=1 Tax=Cokeromyces recurvatus TaxID=90255 RepID=UPI00221F0866|nr:uncharacterized protein BX663DRAFT_532329 [Cokeromyces recurvatus]KAI7900387.1 hypothetical protein BX663DRAFT_532329 [Cokeromyces recurvatus]